VGVIPPGYSTAGWVTIGSTRKCAMKRELGMDEGCRVTATYRTSQKSRIVNMGSSRRDGKASGIELRGDPARNAEARESGGVGVVLRAWESYVQGEGPQPVGSPSNSGTRVRTSGNAPVGCRKTVAGDEASNRC